MHLLGDGVETHHPVELGEQVVGDHLLPGAGTRATAARSTTSAPRTTAAPTCAHASDYLKNFCDHCGATPFFAVVNGHTWGLFNEFRSGRVTQTAGRFTALQIAPYSVTGDDNAKQWRQLVRPMERPLHLYLHERGDLARMGKYLHQRTGGYIASAAQPIREAAVAAVDDGRNASTGSFSLRSS